MGLFSIASNLVAEGLETKIVNLGLEATLPKKRLNVKRRIRAIDARIFGIDLHWCIHSHGAIKLAKLIEEERSDSVSILGGLTATWFWREILEQYPQVDAIVLGEAENSFADVAKAILQDKKLGDLPGVAYREGSAIKANPPKPTPSINDFHFTDLSRLENYQDYLRSDPRGFFQGFPPSFWLPIARGCPYNCIYCGGGSEAYRTVTNREEPALRSPSKVADDVQSLVEQGVRKVCLSHDPEIGGKEYYRKMFREIRDRGIDVSLYVEVFRLPTPDFLRVLPKTFSATTIAFSPESGSEDVRRLVGRSFSNDALLRSIKDCVRLGAVFPEVYFLPGLPGENRETFKITLELITKLSRLPVRIQADNVYIMDPNCLMAVNPQEYGLKLFLRSFNDYLNLTSKTRVGIMDMIGHETSTLSREDIASLIAQAWCLTKEIQKVWGNLSEARFIPQP